MMTCQNCQKFFLYKTYKFTFYILFTVLPSTGLNRCNGTILIIFTNHLNFFAMVWSSNIRFFNYCFLFNSEVNTQT